MTGTAKTSSHDTSRSLPPSTHIGSVALQVSRLDRSIAFYTETLGFQVLERADGHALLGVDGAPHLLELREHANAAAAHARMLGLYHFAILLPDRGALGRLIHHLVERRVPLGAADHLVSEAIYLHDPDNLGIEVYADRPRTQWRTDAGELAMATDPLDIESLLAAAGDASWDGLPAGTIIGHMHLRIGDLDVAREFYHERLGLDVMVTRYPGALFLAAGGYHHHLGLNTWAGPGAAPAPADAARLLSWELIVPYTADAMPALLRLGDAVTELEPDRLWAAEDPWRNQIRIHATNS